MMAGAPDDSKLKVTFVVLHGIILAVGVAIVILLAQPAPGSHPPPSVFIPFALIAWLFLHAILAGLQWLERHGRMRSASNIKTRAWPKTMMVSVLFYLASAATFSLWVVDSISRATSWRFELLIPIAATTYSFATLLAVILRHKLGRYLAGLGLLATGTFGIVAFVLSLANRAPFDVQSIFNGFLAVLVIGFGLVILRTPDKAEPT